MTDIIKAILAINPDATVSVRAEDVDQIRWLGGTSPISKEDILAKRTELRAAWSALAYARARDVAYPTLIEFAEAYCEKEIGGDSTKWDAYVTAYNKVRSDNQKP